MPVPDFSPGEVLTAAAMDSIGLWLVKTQTVGTAVSSVTVNDAFSANYDAYKVVWSGGFGSNATGLALRVGGSTANYSHVLFWTTIGTNVANVDANANTSQCNYLGSTTTTSGTLSCDIINPFISTLHTTFTGGSYIANDFGMAVGRHNVAQSNTSLTVLSLSGTMTGGTIRVYGYRK